MADILIEVGAKPAQSLVQLQKDIAAIESSLSKTFVLKIDTDTKAFERKIDGIKDKLSALGNVKGMNSFFSDFSPSNKVTQELSEIQKNAKSANRELEKVGQSIKKTSKTEIGSKQGITYKQALDLSTQANNLLKKPGVEQTQSFSQLKSSAESLSRIIGDAKTQTLGLSDAVSGVDAKSFDGFKKSVTAVKNELSGTAKISLGEVRDLANRMKEFAGDGKLGEEVREKFDITNKEITKGVSKLVSEGAKITDPYPNLKIEKLYEWKNLIKSVSSEDFSIGSKAHNLMLSQAETIRATIERNAGNWSAAANGRSKNAFENYIEQGKEAGKLADELKAGLITEDEATARLGNIRKAAEESSSAIKAVGENTNSLSARIKGFIGNFKSLVTTAKVVSSAVRFTKEMVSNVVAIDTAMTELRKVTNETEKSYDEFMDRASKRSKNLGMSLTDTITATADFARLGYDVKQAEELADAAIVYKNVGDGIKDISTASESIISTMQAFGILPEEAMSIVDKFNEVGNNFAISSDGIGQALMRSASSMKSAGNTLDETIALITAGNTIVQNPEKMGTTLKTVSMYLRAAKTEAEEAGESTDGMATSVSKLREEILSLTKNKVDIQIDANNFKSTYQIFKELSQVWDELTDITKANILEKIGGKRNSNVTSAIIENFSVAEEVLDTSMNSSGSALAENEKVVSSIQGKINILKSSIESLSTTVISGGLIKGLLDGGAGIIQFLDEIISQIGLLPTLIGAAAGALSLSGTNPLASIVANGEGGVKLNIDPFGLKNDVKSIESYNAAIAAAQQAGEDLSEGSKALGDIISDSMSGASNNAMQFVTALGGAQAPVEGLTGKLIAQKVATVGLNVATSLLTGALVMLAGAAISAAFSAISDLIHADEIAIQKGEEAAAKIKEISNAYQDVSKTVKDSGSRFAELSQHVDQLTGKNIDLSTEEYQEYLNISNELAETFPSLSRIYDENGNAIVGLNGDVQSITASLEELLRVERELAHQKIEENLEDVYTGVKTKADDYSKNIKKNEKIVKNSEKLIETTREAKDALSHGLNDVSDVFSFSKDQEEITVHFDGERDPKEVRELYENLAEILGGAGYTPYIVGAEFDPEGKLVSESYRLASNNLESGGGNLLLQLDEVLRNQTKSADDAQKSISRDKKSLDESWKTLSDTMLSYFASDDTFITLDDTTKAVAQRFISGLNYGELDNGKEYDNSDDIVEYITNNIIEPLRDQSPEVKKAFGELFSIPTSGLGKRDVIKRINELAQTIADATGNAFGTASELIDKLGLDEVLDRYAEDIKNSPVTKEIEKIKQDFSDMYSSKGGRSGARKNFENWIDSLSDQDQDIVYTISLNTDTAEWTLSDWKASLEEIKGDSELLEDALRKVQVAKDAASGVINIDVAGTTERLQTLQSALQSSQSATGLLGDSIGALRNAYGNLSSYDESKLFETTAHGIHLNTTELQRLEKETQKLDNQYIDDYLDNLMGKYESLSEQMADIGSFTPEFTDLSNQRESVLAQIRDLETLQAQYAGATSKYKQWMDAQSGGEEGDIYDSMRSGFSKLDDLRKQGLIGTNEFRAGVQALSYEDMSDKNDFEVAAWYDQNHEKLSRYFADGSEGLKNMAKDLAAINSEWVKLDDNGNILSWSVDVEEAAKALDVSVEKIQAAERKASDYGYEVTFDSTFSDDVERRLEAAGYKVGSLSEKLQEANEKLQELGRTSINFDFETKNEKKLDLEIGAATKLVDGFRDLDGNVDISVEGAEEAQNILMQLLIAKRNISDKPAILRVDTDGAKAEGTLKEIKDLADFINTYDYANIKIAAGVDVDESKAKIDEAYKALMDDEPEILAKLKIDTESIKSSEDLANALSQVSEDALIKVGVDPKLFDDFVNEDHTTEASFIWKNNADEVEAFIASDHTATGTIIWKNKTTDPVSGEDTSSSSNTEGTAKADGTAKTEGVANVDGNWGIEGNGDSLVGELGTELVVRDGRYFTVGENGAEMFHYKKGDIIFNAEQTKQILGKGKISSGRTRGKAFDDGTLPNDTVTVLPTPQEAKRMEVTATDVEVNADKISEDVGEGSGETKVQKAEKPDTTISSDTGSKKNEELDNMKSDFDATVKDIEHEIFLLERKGASDDEIIAKYEELKTKAHDKAQEFRKKGEGDTSDYIQDIQKQWWEFDDKVKELRFDAAITDLENIIALTEEWVNKADKLGDNAGIKKHTADIVSYYDKMQKAAHDEAERYRQRGFNENSEEIKELQKQWWEYENAKLEATADAYERITAIHENSVKQNELFLTKAISNGDIEKQEELRTKLLSEYADMQKEAHEEAEYYRSLGFAETSEEITEAIAKWWEYENAIKSVIQTYEEYRKKLQNSSSMLEIHIDNAISDNDFDGASKLVEELIELYTSIQKNLHEQAEAYRREGLSDDSDEITALSTQWWELENKKTELPDKVKNGINDVLNDKFSQLRKHIEKTTDALQEQSDAYDILIDKQNALADAQERRNDSLQSIRKIEKDIAKELRTNKALSEYLDEDTRKLLFNEDDYNHLSAKLSRMTSDIGNLNQWYEEQINSLTEENWYLEESITNEYERRLKAKESEYEIARAELDLEKKKLELNNVLNERNIRMLAKNENGEYEWQYVHDVNKVSDIMGEISDLENEITETRLQAEEQRQVDEIRVRADSLKNEKSAIDMRITLLNEEIEKFAKSIEDITSPLEEFNALLVEINRYSQGVLKSDISSLLKVTPPYVVNNTSSSGTSSGNGGKSGGSSSSKETYNPKIDYSIAISEAEKMGDYEHAKLMEKKRNAKIDGEGLKYEKTYKYNPKDDPNNKDKPYDNGGIARGKGYLFKDTDSDELVLNPIQTEKASKFAELLERCDLSQLVASQLLKGFKAPTLAAAGVGGDTYNFGDIILPEVKEPHDFMVELKKSLEHNAFKK